MGVSYRLFKLTIDFCLGFTRSENASNFTIGSKQRKPPRGDRGIHSAAIVA
jgi:hypothetical protein